MFLLRNVEFSDTLPSHGDSGGKSDSGHELKYSKNLILSRRLDIFFVFFFQTFG